MTISAVGILSPGEMGSGVGTVLHQHGLRVLTCLAGRGQGSRDRAAQAGFEDVANLEVLVRESQVVLSIVPPAVAGAVADQVAAALRAAAKKDLLYADCNAIAPSTARGVAKTILEAGARFADGGIIGPPPIRPGFRLFTSGPGAGELEGLRDFGLDIRLLEGDVGQASGLKMCYAAMTKGLQALGAELLVAARLIGVEDTLHAQQTEGSGELAAVRRFVERALPSMPPKAYRWIGEMEEISRFFEDLGLPGRLLLGAADVYTNVRDGGLLSTELPLEQAARR
jgi:3-hydroxyisobutyrate dehydrogenase-like beta-hydroxyacid dehydrogenase